MDLTGRQRAHLRALAHHLVPVVQVGKEGVSSALLEALAQTLEDHELIKVKVLEGAPCERREAAPALAEGSGSHVVGQVGRIVILYRRHPEKPKITLPA